MTQTQSARPIRSRRWVATMWVTPALLAALSAGMHYLERGPFDAAWMARTMLIMSLPLLMADRMTMLISARVRRIMGRRFRYFVATTYATFLGVMVILLAHDSSHEQVAVTATVWMVTATLMGGFMSGLPSTAAVQTPDLADRHPDLDKLADGNWFRRTEYLWWTPFAAALWLVLIWTNRAADDLTYNWFSLVVLLAGAPGRPARPPWHRNTVALCRLVGFLMMVGAALVPVWTV
jgi:hypothetical protein